MKVAKCNPSIRPTSLVHLTRNSSEIIHDLQYRQFPSQRTTPSAAPYLTKCGAGAFHAQRWIFPTCGKHQLKSALQEKSTRSSLLHRFVVNALTQVRSECSLLFWVNRLSSANLRGIHALATVDGALPAWVISVCVFETSLRSCYLKFLLGRIYRYDKPPTPFETSEDRTEIP